MKIEINESFDWTNIKFPVLTKQDYINEVMIKIKNQYLTMDQKQLINILKDKWSECIPEEQPFHIELYLFVKEMNVQDFNEWYATIGTNIED